MLSPSTHQVQNLLSATAATAATPVDPSILTKSKAPLNREISPEDISPQLMAQIIHSHILPMFENRSSANQTSSTHNELKLSAQLEQNLSQLQTHFLQLKTHAQQLEIDQQLTQKHNAQLQLQNRQLKMKLQATQKTL